LGGAERPVPDVHGDDPFGSVDPRLTATLTGVVMGTGEVLGGVLSPFLAGTLADGWAFRRRCG
jgi:phage-related minor tail protein